jgi:hypothetical protein
LISGSIFLFPPGTLDQDMPHGLSSGGIEMLAAFPLLLIAASKPKPRFVNQGRGLKGVIGGLADHFRRREFAKFVVNQRQQFLRGLRVALLRTVEDLRDLAHAIPLPNCGARKKPEIRQTRMVLGGSFFTIDRVLMS